MVELYHYSPYGSYGLYRASVPVQGCTVYAEFVQGVMDTVYAFVCGLN